MSKRRDLGLHGNGTLPGLPTTRAVAGGAAAVLGVYLAVRPDYGRDSGNLAAHAAGLPLANASVPVPLAFVPGSLVEQAAAFIQEATGVALTALVKGLSADDQADRIELGTDSLALGALPSAGGTTFSFSSSVFGQAINVSKQD